MRVCIENIFIVGAGRMRSPAHRWLGISCYGSGIDWTKFTRACHGAHWDK